MEQRWGKLSFGAGDVGPPGAAIVASSHSSWQLGSSRLCCCGWDGVPSSPSGLAGGEGLGTGVAATAWAGAEPLALLSPQRALLVMLGGVRAAL